MFVYFPTMVNHLFFHDHFWENIAGTFFQASKSRESKLHWLYMEIKEFDWDSWAKKRWGIKLSKMCVIFEFSRISVLFKLLNLKNRHIYSRLDIDHNEFRNPPDCLFLWTDKKEKLAAQLLCPHPHHHHPKNKQTTNQPMNQPTKQTNRQSAEETFESGIQERRRHSKCFFDPRLG